MPKYGLIHYRVEGGFEEFLQFAKEAGFDCVEIPIQDISDPQDADAEKKSEEIGRKVNDYGLEISAVSAGNDFNVLDEAEIKKQVDRMLKVCKLAKIAGCNTIRTEGGAPKDASPEEKWVDAISGCLQRCVEFVEKEGIYLAVDNHGLITNADGIQKAIFERVGSSHIGANVDFMNYRWFGHSIDKVLKLVREVAPYALHTHVKDGVGSRENYKGKALGEGEIPLAECIKALQDADYEGVWCAEYEGPETEGGVGYKKCLEWMRVNIK